MIDQPHIVIPGMVLLFIIAANLFAVQFWLRCLVIESRKRNELEVRFKKEQLKLERDNRAK